MRRLITAVLAALVVLTAIPASAVPVGPLVPGVPGAALISPNLTHVGTLPLEGVGVSLRFARFGGQLRAFVSSATGLSIYDATRPTEPRLLGHLPMYNWENEDIAVSEDGRTAILTEFDAILYVHIVDVTSAAAPKVVGTMPLEAGHTVACADRACGYLFSSEGATYDIRDRKNPRRLPDYESWGQQTGAGDGHALHRDEAGIWVSDTSPLVVFRLAPDPRHLKVLTRGQITKRTAYQHNNVRPRATRYVPRPRGASLGGPLRDGELLLGQGETTAEPVCSGSTGAFSTWSMVGFERGVPMRQLATLRPVTSTDLDENTAVGVLGCSGHWFTAKDTRDGRIAVSAAWYEHGTRILDVDPRTGAISQIGYFQPFRGSASASYWVPGTDVIWSVDYRSGVDILRFDQRRSKRPTAKAVEDSWLSRLAPDPFSEAMRELCRAGGSATAEHHRRVRALLG